jgi:hypothetical protein
MDRVMPRRARKSLKKIPARKRKMKKTDSSQ